MYILNIINKVKESEELNDYPFQTIFASLFRTVADLIQVKAAIFSKVF